MSGRRKTVCEVDSCSAAPLLRSWGAVVLLGLIVAVGCAPPETERPATESVSGTVTLGGDPVEGAIVTFVPAGAEGESAVGKTDAGGKYTLTTWESGDGAMAGDYTVKIVKFESAAVDESGIEADDEGAFIPTTEDSGQQTSALPEKYSNPGTSELKATVAAGANTFDFALEE